MTEGADYTRRLESLSSSRWRRLLHVQAPYRWNLRRLRLGRTLDVGCGVGRNLAHLGAGSVGVDHNATSVQGARSRGLIAFTPDELAGSPLSRPGGFDALLVAHVLEHMTPAEGEELLQSYLPYLRPGGRVVLITPQERGFASDATHVVFVDLDDLRRLVRRFGLEVSRAYSFPLPRRLGRVFAHNEFILVAHDRRAVAGRPTSTSA